MKLLATGDGYSAEHREALAAVGFEVRWEEALDRDELKELIPSVEAYLLGGVEQLDAELLGRAERLQMISFVGTGIGNFVDESVAVARGVSLFATPGENAAAVAEYTVGLILAATRGILGYNDQVKRGGEPPAQVRELGEATTVGLFGLGNIGERVARILRVAFGANVLYTTRRPRPTAEDALGVERVSVEELFERSQVVSLLAPLTPETEGLVDHRLLSRGAPGLVLVNTGPARVVVAEDLRRAIEGGQVGSAVFDGYWIEPPPSPQEDPFGLLILPDARFSITPHIAAKTPEAWRRMVDGAVANLCDAFDGR